MRPLYRVTTLGVLLAGLLVASGARAGDLDLEDDAPPPKDTPPPAPKARTYNLVDCLALADRNHPSIWAARARLGSARAQLDEATWIPWFQWSSSATAGVYPQVGGSVGYTAASPVALNPTFLTGYEPFFQTTNVKKVVLNEPSQSPWFDFVVLEHLYQLVKECRVVDTIQCYKDYPRIYVNYYTYFLKVLFQIQFENKM